ncbi:MAG: hypothetical protein FJX54_02800 [Alphaproteobacteria bacterium]|nr:hypothetical protein [Alphaproteobacteria bacterium]
MRRLLPFALVLALSACSSAGDVAFKTIENVARAACQASGNCSNTCPDGSTAAPRVWSCPGRP